MQTITLKQTIGADFPAGGSDLRSVMAALAVLGIYKSPLTTGNGGEITRWTDDALFQGLKKFQKGSGIKPDGVAKPGGPTIAALNSALVQTTVAAVANKGGVFTLDGGVGAGQTNSATDMHSTKRALAWAGYYPRIKARAAGTAPDDELGESIRAFQQHFGLKRDGLLRPGGKTAAILDRLITPLVQVAQSS